ncbi:MAG TPA: putative inorganic carbon transporter subunit DabA, partial [Planctomycetaceae bacterium]|nr:putative inorganic carbon transporter subunit DabA [Planctomycetaceae bacterium]
ENGQLGYSLDEMIQIVEATLRAIGLTSRFARLVVFLGHGSTSLNNPHESAYNCGACSGSQGGPNARAFALMANDFRVRQGLANRGLIIPEHTYFVGGYHDTTNDSVLFSDLDRIPISHRPDFEQALQIVDETRARNSHERCRRFESASLTLSRSAALKHVENRPEDLSQARPEYNHATNALCFVGRREWSRGLFLDRRAFLSSYDPEQDDEAGSTLERILQAVVPVCAGINLEYYFSTVDVEGYGCGSKLPHNITSLLGVMTGASSDLKPGLSQQMTEIHEPMRLLFVLETTPRIVQRIIDSNEQISRLVRGGWVQLAVFNPETSHVYRYVRGEFVLYAPESREIPLVDSSLTWYGGQRDHLGFASIVSSPNRLRIHQGDEA